MPAVPLRGRASTWRTAALQEYRQMRFSLRNEINVAALKRSEYAARRFFDQLGGQGPRDVEGLFEKFGFEALGGDASANWLILKNGRSPALHVAPWRQVDNAE